MPKASHDKEYYTWVGEARDVIKPGVGKYRRGVPFTAPNLTRDLFENDPYYAPVPIKEAEAVLKELEDLQEKMDKDGIKPEDRKKIYAEGLRIRDNLVKSLKGEALKARMEAWKKHRDDARKAIALKMSGSKTAEASGASTKPIEGDTPKGA